LIFILIITEDGNSEIKKIYDKYRKRMIYTASQILGDGRGEDAVHDVFINIIDRIKKNPDFLRDKVGQYFVVMVKNHSINILNREKMELIPFDDEILYDDININPKPNLEEALIQKEAVDKMAIYIRQLSTKTRQVLEYRFIEKYSNIEIAEILGVSQSTVSSRLDRGKAQLRKLFEEGGGY